MFQFGYNLQSIESLLIPQNHHQCLILKDQSLTGKLQQSSFYIGEDKNIKCCLKNNPFIN